MDSPVDGERDGETFSSIPQFVGKLQLFLYVLVIYFPYYLLYKLDFLLLLLCWAVTLTVVSI